MLVTRNFSKLKHLKHYAYLMRLHKPIGIWLLLWPTLWALWLANAGTPSLPILFIFICGTVLMRSAGCVMNDLADQSFDPHVKRTRLRPLASKKIQPKEALILLFLLSSLSLYLVWQCNELTIQLAFVGAAFTVIYPFLKRITHLPQLGLGIVFSWGIILAFAAETNRLSFSAFYVFFTCLIWPIIYDTMYAMTDREDDIKIGVKSTAILFGRFDKIIIGCLQAIFILLLTYLGKIFALSFVYYLSVGSASLLFLYQQRLIYNRAPDACFQAFLNNHWVGLIIFLGIVLSYY
jgi:4-hydroxybenzoate polyprenyltransferase